MKTLEFNQMENILGAQDDCLFRSAGMAAGAIACLFSFGWGCAVGLGLAATSSHCY